MIAHNPYYYSDNYYEDITYTSTNSGYEPEEEIPEKPEKDYEIVHKEHHKIKKSVGFSEIRRSGLKMFRRIG